MAVLFLVNQFYINSDPSGGLTIKGFDSHKTAMDSKAYNVIDKAIRIY
jgi:hypothetical protein